MAVSNTASRFFSFATDAELETGTEASKLISPATQHGNLGSCKVWIEMNFAADTIGDSYNVSSVADVSSGITTVNFDRDFETTPNLIYIANENSGEGGGVNALSNLAGSTDMSAWNSTPAHIDATPVCAAIFGVLA
jgi:hypothetical protein